MTPDYEKKTYVCLKVKSAEISYEKIFIKNISVCDYFKVVMF